MKKTIENESESSYLENLKKDLDKFNEKQDRKVTLPTGKTITFNDEQYVGVLKIREWLNSNSLIFTLSGHSGSGKEQPIDCNVQTPNGPKKIGELNIGDSVFNSTGGIVKVNGIFPQGKKQAYKITFRDKTFTECGENHLWAVRTHKLRANKRPYKIMRLNEIIESGLIRGIKSKIHNYTIPLCDPVPYEEKKLPINPYLLGVLIGDGCLCNNVITLSCSDLDNEIIELIKDHIPNYINLVRDDFSNCPRYSFKIKGDSRRNELKRIINDLGLDVKSENKFIPKIYKYSSIEQRWELLRGLMDTDGCSAKNRISFSTSSVQLKDDIIELVQSLGSVAILRKLDKRHKNINYSINIKTFKNPFKLKRKAKNWKLPRTAIPSRHIISIEKSRVCEQVCISLDSEDGLYLTDNYIVTHNTTVLKKIIDEYRKSLVVSAPTHKAKNVVARITNCDGETLHSLLGLRPDVLLDQFNPNDPQFNQIAPPRITNYKLVIIDEASMINEDLFDLIKKELNLFKTTKVLFVGDPAQIPPIGERLSVVFHDDSGIVDKHHLSKVMRQADGNPLFEVYDKLRDNLDKKNGGFKRICKLNTKGEGVTFTKDPEEFRKTLFKHFTLNNLARDIDYVKLLAWRNDTVMASNRQIRKGLFGKKPKLIEVGDIIMGYRSIRSSNQYSNIIDNSSDYRVIKVSEKPIENEYNLMTYEVTIEDRDLDDIKYKKINILDIEDDENLHNFAEIHDLLKFKAKIETNKKKKNELWNDYYTFRRENILMCKIDKFRDGTSRRYEDIITKDIDYGFSITCHKCISGNVSVLTKNEGFKKIKYINVGDDVCVGFGKYRKVINKYNSGIKKSYKLTTNTGYSIMCSEDHKIMDRDFKFKPLKEFNVDEYIPINRVVGNIPNIDNNDKDIFYYLGLLVSDGSYSGSRSRDKYRIDLTIGFGDVENIKFIKRLYEEYNIRYGYRTKNGCVNIYCSRKFWRNKLLSWGLNYVKGESKDIPFKVLNGTYQEKSNFIAGLMDGDGSVSKNSSRIVLTNNSKKLVYNTQKLLLEFGIITYISKERKAYRLYVLSNSIPEYKKYINFRLKRKREILNNLKITTKSNVDIFPINKNIMGKIRNYFMVKGQKIKNKGIYLNNYRGLPKNPNHFTHENIKNIIELSEINNKSHRSDVLKYYVTNFFYDKIKSIEYINEEKMFDLEIDDIHQFVANGFIVHNSQGSTYQHVMILEDDISLNPKTKEMNQIKYVALSRPTTTATVLTHME